MADLQLDTMQPDDWPAVRSIYAEGIATNQATFETETPDWEAWNSARLEVCRLVVRKDGQVVAFAALSPVSRRPAYAGVAEHSIYVSAAVRGQGVGKFLLQGLIEAAEAAGIWTIQSSIFPENAATRALHQSCGFREIGYREKIACHHGVWRDTILIERRSQIAGI